MLPVRPPGIGPVSASDEAAAGDDPSVDEVPPEAGADYVSGPRRGGIDVDGLGVDPPDVGGEAGS